MKRATVFYQNQNFAKTRKFNIKHFISAHIFIFKQKLKQID